MFFFFKLAATYRTEFHIHKNGWLHALWKLWTDAYKVLSPVLDPVNTKILATENNIFES